jgi:bacteriocin-like protein
LIKGRRNNMARMITPEIIGDIKTAADTNELIDAARNLGVELTSDEAHRYYDKLHPDYSKLSEDELDNVTGGCGGNNKKDNKINSGNLVAKNS